MCYRDSNHRFFSSKNNFSSRCTIWRSSFEVNFLYTFIVFLKKTTESDGLAIISLLASQGVKQPNHKTPHSLFNAQLIPGNSFPTLFHPSETCWRNFWFRTYSSSPSPNRCTPSRHGSCICSVKHIPFSWIQEITILSASLIIIHVKLSTTT